MIAIVLKRPYKRILNYILMQQTLNQKKYFKHSWGTNTEVELITKNMTNLIYWSSIEFFFSKNRNVLKDLARLSKKHKPTKRIVLLQKSFSCYWVSRKLCINECLTLVYKYWTLFTNVPFSMYLINFHRRTLYTN